MTRENKENYKMKNTTEKKKDKKEEMKEPINIMKKEDEDRQKFDNQFEVFAELPRVRSLRQFVNEDYTLAKLNKEEREYITDNLTNALFTKMLLDRLWQRGFRYKWNDEGFPIKNEDGSYKKFPLEQEEKNYLKGIAEQVFQTFLAKSHMIAILRRNDADNFLVKLLGKVPEEEKQIEIEKQDKSTMDKIKDFFSGKKKGEGNEDESED